MKECGVCKISKPDTEEFFPKRGNKLNTQCKECLANYRKKHYNLNKEKYLLKSNKNRLKFAQWFDDFKKTLKCKICAEDRFWVLDFHHRDSSTKDYNISTLRQWGSKEKLLRELEKCDVLCSNCHRDYHYHNK